MFHSSLNPWCIWDSFMGVWLCEKGNSNSNILGLGTVRVTDCVMLLFTEHPDLQQLCKARKQPEAASFLYTPFIFHTKFVYLSSFLFFFFLLVSFPHKNQ